MKATACSSSNSILAPYAQKLTFMPAGFHTWPQGAIQTFLRTLSVAQPLASFGLYNGNLYYVLAPPTRSPLSNFPINHDTTLIDGIVPSPVPSPRSPLNFIPINRDTTFTNDLNSLTPSPVPSPRMPLNTVPVNHGSTFSGGGVGRKLRGKRLP